MWGIVPAAGAGRRIQPLAFSKELLPVGSRKDGFDERPKAVSEYLVDRMLAAGVDKICFTISSAKSDIVDYFGAEVGGASVCYVVQPQPAGLCDAVFRALPLVAGDDHAVVGLPDTLWFPENGLTMLPDGVLSFLLFPVATPSLFDAVVTDGDLVREIQVKDPDPKTHWVWGAFKMPGTVFRNLFSLWQRRGARDEYLGTLVNAYLASGGAARGIRGGKAYVDVGTINGFRQAIALLMSKDTLSTNDPDSTRHTFGV